MGWDSLPGLGKVVGPYAPYFGALVPLRLCRAKACPEDYPIPCQAASHVRLSKIPNCYILYLLKKIIKNTGFFYRSMAK